jgi:hypothetical protein
VRYATDLRGASPTMTVLLGGVEKQKNIWLGVQKNAKKSQALRMTILLEG